MDGRLHPGLRHCGGDDPDAPHGLVVVRPVRHRVRLLRAKPGAKRPVPVPHAVRKYPLEVLLEGPARLNGSLTRSLEGPERVTDPVARPGGGSWRCGTRASRRLPDQSTPSRTVIRLPVTVARSAWCRGGQPGAAESDSESAGERHWRSRRELRLSSAHKSVIT